MSSKPIAVGKHSCDDCRIPNALQRGRRLLKHDRNPHCTVLEDEEIYLGGKLSPIQNLFIRCAFFPFVLIRHVSFYKNPVGFCLGISTVGYQRKCNTIRYFDSVNETSHVHRLHLTTNAAHRIRSGQSDDCQLIGSGNVRMARTLAVDASRP